MREPRRRIAYNVHMGEEIMVILEVSRDNVARMIAIAITLISLGHCPTGIAQTPEPPVYCDGYGPPPSPAACPLISGVKGECVSPMTKPWRWAAVSFNWT